MINIFRRHRIGCAYANRRTAGKCPSKPPCPIHFEGTDGKGKRYKPQALIDPRTGTGVRDWAQANEVVRDMEAPEPVMKAAAPVTISEAVDHFLKLKKTKTHNTYMKAKRLMDK